MLVAGFVVLGAKLTQRYGATRVFRVAVGVFCLSQMFMTFSPTATVMISAQALCGASAAVIVPALVALIAEQYTGRQQETAVGALGSARAAAGVLAFVVGGILGTYIGWRPAFGILIVASAIVFFLSFKLKPATFRRPHRRARCGAASRSHHPDQRWFQQSERVGAGARQTERAIQRARPIPGACDDCHRCRARPGVSDVDASGDDDWQHTAAGST